MVRCSWIEKAAVDADWSLERKGGYGWRLWAACGLAAEVKDEARLGEGK